MNRDFRHWLYNMYLDNCEEHREFRTMPYQNLQEYFKTFRWWLRREYRYQRSQRDRNSGTNH